MRVPQVTNDRNEFFEQFDRIHIINLESRLDRRQEMEDQLASLELLNDERVSFFRAIKTKDPGPFARNGSHGAFLSHLAILKSQRHLNETVLILQDDCDFIPDIRATKVSADWDILYGGYHALNPNDVHNSDIIGAHCMAFRPTIIGPLIDFLEKVYSGSIRLPERTTGLATNATIAPPIDGAIVWFRRSHPDVKTVFEPVSYQRSSRTDIGHRRPIDRIPLPFLATAVRFFLRRYRRLRMR